MRDARPTITYFVIFLAAVGFPLAWLGHMEYCAIVDGKEVCGLSFFDRFLSSPPNEIGDTLAGVFGSLAFLAAAIAVVMQSFELSAQREELRLTREEFEAQRKATQDMAASMSIQAKIFEKEQIEREQISEKEKLDELIFLFQEELSESNLSWMGEPDGSGGTPSFTLSFMPRGKYQTVSQETFFRTALKTINEGRSLIEEGIQKSEFHTFPSKRRLVSSIEILDEAIDLNHLLSYPQQLRIERLQLSKLSKELKIFSSLDIWSQN